MKFENYQQFEEKLVIGLQKSFEKLLIHKQKNDQSFVFFQDGKIVTVDAKDVVNPYLK